MGPGAQVASPTRLLRFIPALTWGGLVLLALVILFRTPFPSGSGSWLAWIWAALLLLILFLAARYRPAAGNGHLFPLGLVLALALLLRLSWISLFPAEPVSDFLEYDRIARGFLSGQFQDHYTRPLGYPALLALAYAVYPTALAGRVLNALLGVLAVFFVYQVACKAGGPRAGLIAALLLALQPTEVLLTSVLCSEVGAAAFFAGSAWLLLLSREQVGPPRHAAASGFLLGLGLLFRTALAVHLPWMLAALAWDPRRSPAARWLAAAAFLAGALLPQAALLGWHTAALGRFTWAPLQNYVADFMLLSGTNVESAGMFNEEDMALYWSWPAAERTSHVVETAWQRISSRPLAFVKLVAVKLARLLADSRYGSYWGFSSIESGRWSPSFITSMQVSLAWLEQWAYLLLLLLSGVALLRGSRQPAPFLLFMLAAVLFTAAPHVLLESQERYRHALLPLLCVAAALGNSRQDL